MKDILDKEGLQILESFKIAAKLLDYNIVQKETVLKIMKPGGLKFHFFQGDDERLEIHIYNKDYFIQKSIDVINYEEKNASLKELMEMI